LIFHWDTKGDTGLLGQTVYLYKYTNNSVIFPDFPCAAIVLYYTLFFTTLFINSLMNNEYATIKLKSPSVNLAGWFHLYLYSLIVCIHTAEVHYRELNYDFRSLASLKVHTNANTRWIHMFYNIRYTSLSNGQQPLF